MPEQSGIQITAEDKFSEVFARYDDYLAKIEQHTAKTAEAVTRSGKAMEKQAKEAKGLTANLGALVRQYTGIIAGAYAAYKSFNALTAGIQGAVSLAARVETLGTTLETVGGNAGYTSAEIAKYVEEVKAAGITTQAAMQSLLQMAEAHIDFARGAELARIAQNAANIANINSSEATQRLIYGIQSGQVEILRTMGLNVNFADSYKKLAAQLDRDKDSLTEQEKAQARVNAVVQAGASIAGSYEAAMGTAGKQTKSMERYVEELNLALGRIFLEGFSQGVQEATRLLKDLQEWVEKNQDALETAAESFAALTEALVKIVGLEIDTTALDAFVSSATSLMDALTLLLDWLEKIRAKKEGFLGPGIKADTASLEEERSLFEKLVGAGVSKREGFLGPGVRADIVSIEQEEAAMARLHEKAMATRKKQKEAAEEAAKAPPPALAEEPPDYSKAIKATQDAFDRIQDMQRQHDLQLQREAEDAARDRARAWRDYEKQVRKAMKAGQKRLLEMAEDHEKDQVEAIADTNKRIAKEEARATKDRIKAQADLERQERQARERHNLDRIQSERRYQFERSRLIAEGDTLAIEELDARFKLEQQESEENERLRAQQAAQNQAEQIRETGEAAREQIDELRQQLDETLKEQDENYQEQIEKQKEADSERLAEMAVTFAEQQQMADEDRAIAGRRREEDYQRQLQDLGSNLADQLREQNVGADQVSQLLQQYYGEGGVADSIMQGFHEREGTRIAVTAEMLAGMAAVGAEAAAAAETAVAVAQERVAGVTGYGGLMMDAGGIVRGPASVRVGPGVTEAFVPLARGTMQHNFGDMNVNVHGLESANPADVNAIARGIATTLTQKIQSYRRL